MTLEPLTDDAFAALMAPFDVPAQTPVAVAVSGGPDSTALALCLKRWADKRGNTVRAFIIDHQLRPESAEEAALTRKRFATFGVEVEILRWEHPPIKTRVHVAARKARYDLLLAACAHHNIRHLFLAHQLEDQAETILMRFAKGSGLDGLAGIAPVKEVKGVQLLRPLLSISKQRLIATCEAASVAYATDPSNSAEKYARGRLRRVEGLLAEEGFTAARLADISARAREAKEALEYYTAAFLGTAARMDAAGTLRLSLEQLRSAPQAIALRALSTCLCAIHPTDYPPERAILLPALKALCSSEPLSARTIHGCLVGKALMEAVFTRELAAITDEKKIAAGETVLWDGRWKVTLSPHYKEQGLVIRVLGVQTHDVLDKLNPTLRHKVHQGRARAALPAIWNKTGLMIIPDIFAPMDSALAHAAILAVKNIPVL